MVRRPVCSGPALRKSAGLQAARPRARPGRSGAESGCPRGRRVEARALSRGRPPIGPGGEGRGVGRQRPVPPPARRGGAGEPSGPAPGRAGGGERPPLAALSRVPPAGAAGRLAGWLATQSAAGRRRPAPSCRRSPVPPAQREPGPGGGAAQNASVRCFPRQRRPGPRRRWPPRGCGSGAGASLSTNISIGLIRPAEDIGPARPPLPLAASSAPRSGSLRDCRPGPAGMEAPGGTSPLNPALVGRLRQEHEKVVTSCQEKIQHWKKVESDYEALQERLSTLPDKLSYDVMVPFGPLAFMPGKLVHTNEVTVLLGDNWFSKCSAKQAVALVEHRKKHVRKALDDLQKVMKNFESRVEFTEDLQKMSDAAGDFVDIREEIEDDSIETKGKYRTAHKPHSKPKVSNVFEVDFPVNGSDTKSTGRFQSEEELWARLEELERQEEILGELDRMPDTVEANGEDTTSSDEENEEKRTDLNGMFRTEDCITQGSFHEERTNSGLFGGQINGSTYYHSDDEDDVDVGDSSVPTIFFSHTVEPKRVRINTGKNTTLKFSEKKEEAKRKRKNSNGNGHATPELPNIKTPADIYRVFVDVVNGEYVPRKSILKSRSRENSVCSDTSENSAAEFDDRRGVQRSISCDEATQSDNSEGILEEEEEEGRQQLPKKLPPSSGTTEAFSGTVIEKEPLSPSLIPHPVLAHPVLPTILERKSDEVLSEASEEPTKRISKFKASRMQQTN
ncbi:unconventional prefoldin RPB5 interactor 1 [Porphyrio hochstetteri]